MQLSGFAPASATLTLAVGDQIDIPILLRPADLNETVRCERRRRWSSAPHAHSRRRHHAARSRHAAAERPQLSRSRAAGARRVAHEHAQHRALRRDVGGARHRHLGRRPAQPRQHASSSTACRPTTTPRISPGTYFGEEVIREFQVITSGRRRRVRPRVGRHHQHRDAVRHATTRAAARYGFFRDDALDARNPLATRKDPLTPGAVRRSAVGGPIVARPHVLVRQRRAHARRTGPASSRSRRRSVERHQRARSTRVGYAGPRIATGEFPTGYDTTNVFGRVDHAVDAAHAARSCATASTTSRSENARSVGGLNAVSRGTAARRSRPDRRGEPGCRRRRGVARSTSCARSATRSRLARRPNDLIGPAVDDLGRRQLRHRRPRRRRRATSTSSSWPTRVTLQRGGASAQSRRRPALQPRRRSTFPARCRASTPFTSLANLQRGRLHQLPAGVRRAVAVPVEPEPRRCSCRTSGGRVRR